MLVERLVFSDLSKILQSDTEKNFIVIIDQLNDPNNLGAILRTCLAFNIINIIVFCSHITYMRC